MQLYSFCLFSQWPLDTSYKPGKLFYFLLPQRPFEKHKLGYRKDEMCVCKKKTEVLYFPAISRSLIERLNYIVQK